MEQNINFLNKSSRKRHFEMMQMCSFFKCHTTSSGSNVKFYPFPKNEVMRNIWIKRSKRRDRANIDTAVMCSTHFAPDCFEDDRPDVLKEGAIPTIEPSIETYTEIATKKKLLHRQNNSSEREPKNVSEPSKENDQVASVQQTLDDEKLRKLQEDNAILKNLYEQKEQIIVVNTKTVKQLRTKVNSLRTYCNTMKQKIQQNQSKFKRKLDIVFTKAQQDKIFKRKKIVKWNDEDITKALTLKYLSRDFYTYLKETLNYPLPAISSLEKWALKYKQPKEG